MLAPISHKVSPDFKEVLIHSKVSGSLLTELGSWGTDPGESTLNFSKPRSVSIVCVCLKDSASLAKVFTLVLWFEPRVNKELSPLIMFDLVLLILISLCWFYPTKKLKKK